MQVTGAEKKDGNIPNSQDGAISVCPVFHSTFKVGPGAARAW